MGAARRSLPHILRGCLLLIKTQIANMHITLKSCTDYMIILAKSLMANDVSVLLVILHIICALTAIHV